MTILQGILGLAAFIGLAWLLSEDRRSVSKRIVLTGLGLQLAVGLVLLELPVIQGLFIHLNKIVTAFEDSTSAGAQVLFGYLSGGTPPFDMSNPAANYLLAFFLFRVICAPD